VLRLVLAALWLSGCSRDTAPAAPSTERPAVSSAAAPRVMPARPLRRGRPPHLEKGTAEEYAPLAQHLARVLAHEVEIVVPKSYDEVVLGLADGSLDLGLLTPFVYVKAQERVPGLVLLASLLGEGSPRYRGYIVVRSDSPVQDLAGLRGRRFGFVDPDSASGYLFPLALLLDAGLVPSRDFAVVEMTGSHGECVHRVIDGRLDAGAVSSTTFQHMRTEAIAQKLRIIGKTDWIPLDAFVAHPSLPEDVIARLRDALLGLSLRTPEGREVLQGVTTINGFVPGDDRAYDPIRRVAARVAP
jgi:phosphate/phosphite/phosphonate ABC transporter binding protein